MSTFPDLRGLSRFEREIRQQQTAERRAKALAWGLIIGAILAMGICVYLVLGV